MLHLVGKLFSFSLETEEIGNEKQNDTTKYGSPEFNFSAALVNGQLVCLPPGLVDWYFLPCYVYVNVLSLFVCIGPTKPQRGVANLAYIRT